MDFALASNGLAPWGQAAAIILALYLFISILVGLALVAGLMFALAWIREKAELVRDLRPQIARLNQAATALKRNDPLPREAEDHKIIAAIAQAPKVVDNTAARVGDIEQKVEQGSQRVADAVIEFHARVAMAKGMAKAFFLPGLTRRVRPIPAPPVQTGIQEAEREPEQPEQEQVLEPVAAARDSEAPPLEREIVITQYTR
jgi:hypothetical protein